ncbi:unnamed protein product, partial [Allacma fusca]
MENKIKTLALQHKFPKDWKIICSAFLSWKWKLTARDIFEVNYRLITG